MRRHRRSLILCGVLLLFPLLVWLGFVNINGLIFFVPEAHSAGDADDQHTPPGTREQVHGGPILLPEKRTTLLNRVQMSGYAKYQYYCAACHGTRGAGNGVNARNLSIPPRRHNDASYMANLSNTYLSKIIKEGGPSQGLSPLMPPWGRVLSEEEILNLIAFIRILPESQMLSSVEEQQKSAGMGGHGHGGGEADDHQAGSTEDHQGAEGDDQHGSEGNEQHAAGADDHLGAEPDDHHQAEPGDHHEAEADDHHGSEGNEQHAAGADDHLGADPVDHHEAEPDDHNEMEVDEHGAADPGDHHAN